MINERQFWDWFKENEAKYFFLNQIDDNDEKEQYLDELLVQLHLYCENLFFEVGGYPNDKQDLIITAEGNADFFDKAEFLVRQAPQLEHWNVIALKPAMEADTIQYNKIQLSPETMWFIPLSNEKSQKLGLRVYIDQYNPADAGNFLTATYLVLDNILGEKSSALDIGYVEIENLPVSSQRDELIELIKLPRYIKWKKDKGT